MKKVYLFALLLLCLAFLSLLWIQPKSTHTRIHHHREGVRADTQTVNQEETIQSHLPIIVIDTKGQVIPGLPENLKQEKENEQSSVEVDVKLHDDVHQKHTLSEKERIASKAQISYRGNSSRHFDKKSLKLRFISDHQKEREISVAGMAKESEWVLNGPFLDRTLVRNYLAYNIAGEIMDYAPNVRYCELVIDGVYQGLYLLTESIEQGPHRVHIDKSDRKSRQTSYIVAWDREYKARELVDNYTHYIHQAGVSGLDIHYPGPNRLTQAQADFIQKDISQIEKMLYSYDLKDYPQYIDRNSFAEYFIINEMFRNADAGKFSTYLYKDLRDKMKTVVWDFNNAFNNQIETAYDEAGFTMLDVPWFSMLLKDPDFVTLVTQKYHELRKTTLSTEYLTNYIDETISFLGPAIQRNNEKWGYVFSAGKIDPFNYLQPAERNVESYDDAVEQLKDFIERRGRWLDRHIETLYQYSASSKNANTLLE